MSGMDFEYAIKKDIRNNPIVREVDEARQRQLWRSMGIGLFLVVVLLFSAWQHFEMLRHGYQIERMQQERAAEEEVNRHLRARGRDAARAAPHRADRDRTAAPRRARARPGDRHRARDAVRAAREIHRRRPLDETACGTMGITGARSRCSDASGAAAPGPARREPRPIDWRADHSRRGSLVCAGGAGAVDRRHRGAARLPAGHRARRLDGRAPTASRCAPS